MCMCMHNMHMCMHMCMHAAYAAAIYARTMSGCSTISEGEIGPFSRASAERAWMASRHACRLARHACRLLSDAFAVAVAVAVALSPRCAATPLSSAIASVTPLSSAVASVTPLSGPPRVLSGATQSASSHVPVSLLT